MIKLSGLASFKIIINTGGMILWSCLCVEEEYLMQPSISALYYRVDGLHFSGLSVLP